MNFAPFPGEDLELRCLLDEWGRAAAPSEVFPWNATSRELREALLHRLARRLRPREATLFEGTAKSRQPFLPSRTFEHNLRSLQYQPTACHLPGAFPGVHSDPNIVRVGFYSEVTCLYPGRFQEKTWVKVIR